jgi:hypothetical protein
MNNRSYEIIYRFKHQSGNILQEIKYIDVPENTPKSKKYQWFHLKDQTLTTLNFLAQHGTTRSFVEGTLTVYPEYCLFNGVKYDIQEIALPIVYTPTFYLHGIMEEIS